MNTQKKEIDIIDLLTALHAGRWLIIGGTLAICVLAGGLSFLLPKEYEATVQILPPQEEKQSFGFSSLLSSLPIPTLRLGERGTPADISLATIRSLTARRRMVEKFGLMQRYEARTLTDALEALANKTTADMTEEGMLAISVLDQDPQMAADMANYYIVLLDSTNKRFSHKTASERLSFIRGLLQEEDKKLEDKMKRLEEFQSEHNAIAIADQARAVILTATSMQTAAMELEIERQRLLQSGLGPNHDKVKRLEREILPAAGDHGFLARRPQTRRQQRAAKQIAATRAIRKPLPAAEADPGRGPKVRDPRKGCTRADVPFAGPAATGGPIPDRGQGRHFDRADTRPGHSARNQGQAPARADRIYRRPTQPHRLSLLCAGGGVHAGAPTALARPARDDGLILMTIQVKVINKGGQPLPTYETAHSAGLDLRAALSEEVVLAPGERGLIPTGLFLEIPPGYEAQVRPRSGLALKRGLTLLNAPGTIDADYRGEVGVIMVNLSAEEQRIGPGDRIAQLIFAPVTRGEWIEVDTLDETERGSGGFGSTGAR